MLQELVSPSPKTFYFGTLFLILSSSILVGFKLKEDEANLERWHNIKWGVDFLVPKLEFHANISNAKRREEKNNWHAPLSLCHPLILPYARMREKERKQEKERRSLFHLSSFRYLFLAWKCSRRNFSSCYLLLLFLRRSEEEQIWPSRSEIYKETFILVIFNALDQKWLCVDTCRNRMLEQLQENSKTFRFESVRKRISI